MNSKTDSSYFLDILHSLRITHWMKNGLIFSALIFSENVFNMLLLGKTIIGFFLFGLTASSIYVINDLADLENDRNHPVKKNRPISSGKIDPKTALILSIVLAGISFMGGFAMNFYFGGILLLYFLINILYTLYLKHVVILDIFCVASGFFLRVVAGVVIIQVGMSNWLIICTSLLALFLSFAKRRHELVLLGDKSAEHRKILEEYSPYFLDQMIAVSTSATVVCYILYTISNETVSKFGTDKLLFTIPFVLYGIFRYLYLVHIKEEGGNPTKLLIADKPILINIFLWIVTSIVILYMK